MKLAVLRKVKMKEKSLEWQKEGFFDTLIFSKDDCAEFGFNVDEANELEKLGGKIVAIPSGAKGLTIRVVV